ncbi:MAG: complement resistance protein TraT [Acidobacteriota bacterium]|nr:complement resistance protein TraT [Acidobacteriota bacterium]
MMSNLRLMLVSAASGALLCGFVGALIGAVAGRGTSVLLPGLGLIIAGPIAAGVAVGLMGAMLGFALGLSVAAIIIFTRRKNYP